MKKSEKREFCNEVFGNRTCLSWLKNERCPSENGKNCCSKFMQPLEPVISSLENKDENTNCSVGIVNMYPVETERAYF